MTQNKPISMDLEIIRDEDLTQEAADAIAQLLVEIIFKSQTKPAETECIPQ
jgi:hypothetical protein